MELIRLLVVDDHTLFRRGLIALLSQDERFEVTGQAGDIGEALRCVAQAKPDLVLLDNHLPGVLGVDGIASLKAAAPGIRILMLTVSENENDLAAALQGVLLDLAPVTVHVRKGQGIPAYSIFEGTADDGTTLAEKLDELGITDIDVVGIATDYCVLASALDAVGSGRRVRVLSDLVAGVAPDSSAAALVRLAEAGALIAPSASPKETP